MRCADRAQDAYDMPQARDMPSGRGSAHACSVGIEKRRLLRQSVAAMAASAQGAEEAMRRIELVRAHGYEDTMLARFADSYQKKYELDWQNICMHRVRVCAACRCHEAAEQQVTVWLTALCLGSRDHAKLVLTSSHTSASLEFKS